MLSQRSYQTWGKLLREAISITLCYQILATQTYNKCMLKFLNDQYTCICHTSERFLFSYLLSFSLLSMWSFLAIPNFSVKNLIFYL